jgi:uncharacterized tellurite resistance protein B-like protein
MKTEAISLESGLNYKQFYKELGSLLYAIAYSDGQIQKEEVEALREFVLKELAPFEPVSDSSGMNLAFYTQFEFEDIEEKHAPASVMFWSFMRYLKSNAPLINEQLKTSIIKAVEKVALAYNKIDKQELDMINLLKKEIESL